MKYNFDYDAVESEIWREEEENSRVPAVYDAFTTHQPGHAHVRVEDR